MKDRRKYYSFTKLHLQGFYTGFPNVLFTTTTTMLILNKMAILEKMDTPSLE